MEDFCRRYHRALLLGLLLLGLGLRTFHYLRDPAMWHDEAAQVINILDKSFAEFQGPLFFAEASPPGFMWLVKAWVLMFGDSTYALRFLPWLASCLTMVGVVWIGRRFLDRSALLVLTLLIACSDRLLWHSCEAKAYALDALISVGMLAGLATFQTFAAIPGARRRRSLPRLLLSLACLSPLCVVLSFPACFVLGAAGLVLGVSVWREWGWDLAWRYGLWGLALAGTFLALVLGPIRAQQVDLLQGEWAWNYPRWDEPWSVPVDGCRRITEVFRYASEPIGNLLIVPAALGAWLWWRQGRGRLLAFVLLPLGLNVVAWLASRYPLGPSRVNVYLAPLLLLLVAAGFPALAIAVRSRIGWVGAAALIALLAAVPMLSAYRVLQPWPRMDSREAAAFVLGNRQSDEPVVGMHWEHRYYFRRLGLAYRDINPGRYDPPTLPPTLAVTPSSSTSALYARRLWLIVNHRDIDPVLLLERLEPHGVWRRVEQRHFDIFSVYYLQRPENAFAER